MRREVTENAKSAACMRKVANGRGRKKIQIVSSSSGSRVKDV